YPVGYCGRTWSLRKEVCMPLLFISHSNEDDPLATALERWLVANGFTEVFVDHAKAAEGEPWREALRASVGACRVVLFLVSPAWLGSDTCFGEFKTAWLLGKRIVPLFLLRPGQPLNEVQAKRLASISAED